MYFHFGRLNYMQQKYMHYAHISVVLVTVRSIRNLSIDDAVA